MRPGAADHAVIGVGITHSCTLRLAVEAKASVPVPESCVVAASWSNTARTADGEPGLVLPDAHGFLIRSFAIEITSHALGCAAMGTG